MVKFCPECKNPIIDDSKPFCPKCGIKLPIASSDVQASANQPSADPQSQSSTNILPTGTDASKTTAQTSASMDRQEIFGRAIPFFTTRSYAVQTQTDYVIAFESQKRDVSWVIFLVFCCLGIIPAVIYYYWFTHKHQVTVSLSGITDVKVTAIGNTIEAKQDAADFMKTLS